MDPLITNGAPRPPSNMQAVITNGRNAVQYARNGNPAAAAAAYGAAVNAATTNNRPLSSAEARDMYKAVMNTRNKLANIAGKVQEINSKANGIQRTLNSPLKTNANTLRFRSSSGNNS